MLIIPFEMVGESWSFPTNLSKSGNLSNLRSPHVRMALVCDHGVAQR